MQQQSEETTASVETINVAALAETAGPQNRAQIAALAFALWQARGCSDGTPDEDWFRAEQEIAVSTKIAEEEIESRDPADLPIEAEEANSPVLRFPVGSELLKRLTPGLREGVDGQRVDSKTAVRNAAVFSIKDCGFRKTYQPHC